MEILINSPQLEWFLLIFIMFLSTIIFIILGRIILSTFNFKNKSSLFSLPVGFIFYQFITFFFYIPFLLFNSTLDILYWVSLIKNIMILVLILILHKKWFPYKFQLRKPVLLKSFFGFSTLAFSILIFILMSEYIEIFNHIDKNSQLIEEVVKMTNKSGKYLFKPFGGKEDLYTVFQTYYYDIAMISKVTNISVMNIFKFIVPTWGISLLFSAVKFSLKDLNTTKSLILSFLITFIFSFFLQSSSSDEGMFIGTSLFLTSLIVLYNDSQDKETSSRNMILSFLFVTTIFFMSSNSLIFILLMITIIIFYNIKNKNTVLPFLSISMIILAIISSLILYNVNFLSSAISGLVFTFFIIPIWTLQYGPRKKDRIKVMKNINDSEKWIIYGFFSLLAISGIVISSIEPNLFIEYSEKIYTSLFSSLAKGFNNSLSILFNILIIYIPLALTLFFIWLYSDVIKNKFIYLIPWIFIILLNPLSLSLWETIFQISVDTSALTSSILLIVFLNIKTFITKSIIYKEV